MLLRSQVRDQDPQSCACPIRKGVEREYDRHKLIVRPPQTHLGFSRSAPVGGPILPGDQLAELHPDNPFVRQFQKVGKLTVAISDRIVGTQRRDRLMHLFDK